VAARKTDVRLGSAVVYRMPESQLTTTKRGTDVTQGSVYHPTQAEFAGLVVTAAQGAQAQRLIIFPPDRPAVFVNAALGEGPGTFSLVEAG
jgi:hypothetical protein